MKTRRVPSGVPELDRLLGGLRIGDNVVWHDDAGSLAWVFCHNFLLASMAEDRPLIYVVFDRSPRSLLERLGPLARYPSLTILDCFTHGKGAGSEVFMRFYEEEESWPCRIQRVEEPDQVDGVMEAFYGIHASLEGDVRFVFESLTGMQELWGGEEELVRFYSHSCPRLYELNTIAYWILERRAHSPRLRAQINQIAQVAIELGVKRGTTSLSIIKAEKRDLETLNRPFRYWVKDYHVTFDTEKKGGKRFDLGMRIKELRGKRGLSQSELAKLVGVTPSSISQVESNLVYPSLPALIKMAEVLSVDISAFFQDIPDVRDRIIFPADEAVEVKLPELPEESLRARLLTPVELDAKAEPYLIEIPPGARLSDHFFFHKGEEMGYLLGGRLQVRIGKAVYTLRSGDVIYLTYEIPSGWSNPGNSTARLLWVKIRA